MAQTIRSPAKTAAVAKELNAPYHLADFTDLAQVRRLAGELLAAYPRIDVLANNAALFTKELHRRYHARGLSAVAFHPGISPAISRTITVSFK